MDLDLARQHWQDGNRRVEAAKSDRRRYAQLVGDIDLVVAHLRKRVGQRFTLDELAAAYDGSDDWVRELLDDADPEGPGPSEPGTVGDAAFHVYARGAADYRP
ncbi:MAG TPA: hypothetical protein VHC67_01715 [Gaiellaceae bacterium]|jgi:hypothetical protein|nr:hypothetical protein [Gaiellaceae bacterium]